MKKVTLSFPTHDSLWLFKDKSTAINVAVMPMKNTITGLFSVDEVDIALREFQAVRLANTSTTGDVSLKKHMESGTAKPSFKFRFAQLLAMMNL